MSSPIHATTKFPQASHVIVIAALLGATFLSGPLMAAPADVASTETPTTSHKAAAKTETVEQRITDLHKSLRITADEETNWTAVAQAMRENAANGQKLAAEKVARAPSSMTAVDDLKSYETFAQSHVDGLKNLISSFSTLYDTMPAAQKKNADQVFESFGRKGVPTHS
jgi:protein CpxP